MNEILCKEARLTLVVMLLMLLAAGCARNPYFKVMNASEKLYVEAGDDSPVPYSVNVSMDYPMVKGDTTHVATAIRYSIVDHMFGWEYDTLDAGTATKMFAQSLLDDFKSLSADMKTAGMYSDGSGTEQSEWYENLTGYFAGSWKHFSSYVVEYSGYSGGTRPDMFTNGLVFDLNSGAEVTLDDLFKPGFDEVMGDLIRLHAEECLPAGAMEVLFEPSIVPTGNFVLTGKSITFIYNPYEIAPYGLGILQISVPLRECRKAGILAEGI